MRVRRVKLSNLRAPSNQLPNDREDVLDPDPPERRTHTQSPCDRFYYLKPSTSRIGEVLDLEVPWIADHSLRQLRSKHRHEGTVLIQGDVPRYARSGQTVDEDRNYSALHPHGRRQ